MKHFKQTKRLCLAGFMMTAALLILPGCDDGVGPSDTSGKKNWLITVVVGQDQQSSSCFLGGFNDLDVGSIDNSNSFEHTMAASPHVYEDIVIVTESFMGDKIHKYTLDSDNNLSESGSMNLPQGSYATSICFAGRNKAYLSMAGLGKIRVFDPANLETISDIDLTDHAVGANDNNPEPGDMIIRDGKLFVSLGQAITIMPPSGHDSAWCAIIDVATNTVEKVIVDSRACGLGYGGHTRPFIDENNDIYFYAIGQFGYQAGATEGFLRIRSGETEFDDSYYFSLDETGIPGVPDQGLTHAMKSVYAGNGMLYAIPQVPAWTSNPPDYETDRNYQPCKVDVWNKTIEKLDIPPTAGYSAMGVEKAGDLIVFALATDNGTGLFTHNHATGESTTSPVVTTQGNPMYLKYLGAE
jgi:hypothetical protein